MRIAIIGAGAVGGFLANRLAAAHDVTVLARGAHLAAIKAGGLRVVAKDGSETVARVAATDDPADLGPQDLLIATLKAPALPDVLTALRPLLRDGVPLIAAMNGIFWWYGHGLDVGGAPPDTARLDPDGHLAAAVAPQDGLGMIIYSANTVIAPGVVENATPFNRYTIGAATPAGHARAEALAAALAVPGLEVSADPDIRRFMWRKLLLNLTTAPTSVLTGADAYTIFADPDARAVAQALFHEGVAVAAAHGFTGLADPERVFRPELHPRHVPSIRQDLDLGRPMEIDTILRVIQDFARQAGVATPTLDALVPLVILSARAAGGYPPAAPPDTPAPAQHSGPLTP